MSESARPTPPDYLTPEQLALFDRLSERVVKLRLTMPAVLFLESTRPLNFIGSQVMVFFAPMVHALFAAREYNLLQQALERRETIGFLVDLLEAKEQAEQERERSERQAKKAATRKKRP
jgi:hypothetical protein